MSIFVDVIICLKKIHLTFPGTIHRDNIFPQSVIHDLKLIPQLYKCMEKIEGEKLKL